jgi:putative two-component system response regulator
MGEDLFVGGTIIAHRPASSGTDEPSVQEMAESLPQGVSIVDADLKLAFWNRQFLELLDFPEHLVRRGTPFEAVIRYNAERGEYGPGDPEEHVRQRVALARSPRYHRFERTRLDGRVLEIVGVPLAGGGFVTTYTDITTRKNAEAELVRQRGLLRTILDNAPCAISIYGPDLRMVGCNEEFKRLLDLPETLFRDGLPTFEELAWFNAERGDYGPGDPAEKAAKVLAQTRVVEPHMFERARPDGTVVEIRGAPLPGGGFITIHTDVTARKIRENEMRDRATWLAAEVEKATRALVEREDEIIFRLSRAAEHRDTDTGAHLARIAHASRLVARRLGLSEEEQDLVFRAAPMHDVGKVGIADSILLKPGKLTEEEFQVMKTHTTIGHAILRDSPSRLLQVASEIARFHHEKFDGSGYPDGLAGEDIPIQGRIVAVVDVFDALTSVRPYKKAWPVEQAAAYIREQANGHFDPWVVEAFFAGLDEIVETSGRYRE